MTQQLQVVIGQATDKGRKPVNQDFHGVMLPPQPLLASKGVVAAISDGVSSSEVSQVASETSVKSFLQDYYATSEAWSVKNSAQRVLKATNSWLYSATRNGPYRYHIEKGYVCTFSALVIKSATAHIFHVGDARVYRVSGNRLEQLTDDHRQVLSPEKSYLSRALGMRDSLEIDYGAHSVDPGDTFLLTTDGVYEFAPNDFIATTISEHADDLERAARVIVDEAYRRGSDDNLTLQIVRVDQVPRQNLEELQQSASELPFPPELRPRMEFDAYRIIRQLHASARSHVFLAQDIDSDDTVVLKLPSVDLREDPAYIESFLMEEWIARRLNNPHLLKAPSLSHSRNYLYTVTEYVEGITLQQWMVDNPDPDLETVRTLVEQISRGLQAIHRQEMLHQDLRPANIMLDRNGTAKIIDFGAVRVAGIVETGAMRTQQNIIGTMQYTAPEYFVGAPADARADLFSLGVITYQMLSGRLPYGTSVARATSRSAQNKLRYQSVLDTERSIPLWVDATLRRAVHPDPNKRYGELSEFVHDLRHPNPKYLRRDQPPLMEKNPLLFWKGVSLLLMLTVLALLVTHPNIHS